MASVADYSHYQHQEMSFYPFAVNHQTGIFTGSFPDDSDIIDKYLMNTVQDTFINCEGDSSESLSSCGSDKDVSIYGCEEYYSDIDNALKEAVMVLQRERRGITNDLFVNDYFLSNSPSSIIINKTCGTCGM